MLVLEAKRRKKLGGELYLCGLKQQAREVLERGGYLHIIGEDHLFDTEGEAVSNILPRLDSADCHSCAHRIFKECNKVCSI